MLLATALARTYYGMCSTDVYCSKQTGSSSTKETIPIISSFLELGRENCRCGQKFMAVLLKQKQQTFVNGLLGFITETLLSAGSACVLLTIIA